jgi:hypothetical protein
VDQDVNVEPALAEISWGIFKHPDIGGRHTATFPYPVAGALEEADQGGMGALDMGLVEVNGNVTVKSPASAIREQDCLPDTISFMDS